MNKDEILAKSREENKNGEYDENIRQIRIMGYRIALIITVILLLIYSLLIDHNQINPIFAILFSGFAGMNIYEAIKNKSTLYIVCAVVFTLNAIFYITRFVLKF